MMNKRQLHRKNATTVYSFIAPEYGDTTKIAFDVMGDDDLRTSRIRNEVHYVNKLHTIPTNAHLTCKQIRSSLGMKPFKILRIIAPTIKGFLLEFLMNESMRWEDIKDMCLKGIKAFAKNPEELVDIAFSQFPEWRPNTVEKLCFDVNNCEEKSPFHLFEDGSIIYIIMVQRKKPNNTTAMWYPMAFSPWDKSDRYDMSVLTSMYSEIQ